MQKTNACAPGGDRVQLVNAALLEWKNAVRYFENVKDPELVDFAIYEMEAARRKYMFLLKRTGRSGR